MTASPAAASPRARRRRALLAAFALLLAGAVIVLGPGRPLLERWFEGRVTRRAEAALSAALGVRVDVGSATLDDRRTLRLSDVSLEGVRVAGVPGGPWLASIAVERVDVIVAEGGSLTGPLDHLESLTLIGPVVELGPASPGGTAAPSDAAALPTIDSVAIRRGRLVADDARSVLVASVEGDIARFGSAPSGRLEVRATAFPLGALLRMARDGADQAVFRALPALKACCGAATLRVDLAADGALRIAGPVELPAGVAPADVPGAATATLAVTADAPDGDGRRRLQARVEVPGVLVADATGTRDAAGTVAWASVVASAPAVPEGWLPASMRGVASWRSASVRLRATPSGEAGADVEALASLAGARLRGSRTGVVDLGAVEATLTARVDGSRSLAGTATLSADGEPLVHATGTVTSRDAGMVLDLAWTLAPDRLAAWAPALGPVLGVSARVLDDAGATGTLSGSFPSGLLASADVGPMSVALAWGASEARIELSSAQVVVEPAHVDLRADGSAALDGLPGPSSFGVHARAPRAAPALWKAEVTAGFAGGLGSMRATGAGRSAGGGTASVAWEGAALLPVVRVLAPDSMHLERLDAAGLAGAVSAGVDLEWDATHAWSARGRGLVSRVAGESRDHARAVAVGECRWTAEAGGGPEGARVAIDAELGGLQILRGSVFADLAEVPPALRLVLSRGRGEGWSGGGTLVAGPLVSAAAQWQQPAGGGEGGAGTTLSLSLDVADAAAAFAALRRSGALDGSPFLDRLVPGGAASVTLSGRAASGAIELDGTLSIDDLGVVDPDGTLAVDGLSVSLPFALHREQEASPWSLGAGASEGRLTASRVEVLGASARDVASTLTVSDDAIRATDPLGFDLLGGRLTLGALALRDAVAATPGGPSLEARVEATGLQLAQLGPVGPFRLEGMVGATFPRVALSAVALDVDGGARVLAWGGEIDVRSVSVEEPLGRFPRTRISASFADIDLLELTRTFGFGAISGVAEGSIEDFELFGSTPTRFAATLETVPRDQVPQAIAIPALQNLATLATGGRAPIFEKGLLKLVKTLRYEKLGMSATLRADAFVLRGLAERQGRELFLKGRLPIRVDVANAEPGAAVSFRAMMARLAGLEGVGAVGPDPE